MTTPAFTVKRALETTLFASRWLMAPMYLGLVMALVMLLVTFAQELWHMTSQMLMMAPNDMILGVLSLIDLSLAANLILIVIFSGYENFVSKMYTDDEAYNPEWKGSVDFATLKLKLVASIVAISGIHLLKVFMDVNKYDADHIRWMVIIHLVFVVSGVLLAYMDKIAVTTKNIKKPTAKGKSSD